MKRLASVVVLASAIGLFAPMAAQTPPPVEYLTVATITVKPAAVADFEDYLKKLHAAGLKIGVKTRADTYQVVQGGSPFEYSVVTGFQTLGEVGAMPGVPAILMKAYGDVEGGRIMRTGRTAIDSVESVTLRYQADLSTKPRPPVGSPFFQLVQQEIDPKMAGEFTEYLRKLKAAGDKFPAAVTALRHTNQFGPAFSYLTAIPFNTWADLDKVPNPPAVLASAYSGAELLALQQVNIRAVVRRNILVVQYRRDLSRVATGTTTN